ncbi:helix-turn-helix transcriptional regulator, partial [Klebsiella variicola]
MKQYIYLNIKENISVTDIAFVFGVTRQYLHRKFKKETGQSIM